MDDPRPEDSPQDAWLDVCLEEQHGAAVPDDLAARIARCLRERTAEPARAAPARRGRPRAAAAAILALGLATVLAVAKLNSRGESSPPATSPPVRVLLVATTPSFEFRYLRNALLRARPEVQLQTWLASAPADFEQDSSAGTPPLRALPHTAEELRLYHAVILLEGDPGRLGDLPFAGAWLTLLADYTRAGGGLLVVTGSPDLPAGARESALGPILPRGGSRWPTVAGERDWDGPLLEMIGAWHRGPLPRKDRVLARGGSGEPLAALGERLRGRVMVLYRPETWRLRQGDERYERLWHAIVRWLAGG